MNPPFASAVHTDDSRVLDLRYRRRATDRQADGLRVLVRAAVDDAADRAAFRDGLVAKPARTSPKFFYDEQGAALFTAICELDEYYPTRTEAAIFERRRTEIAAHLPRGAQWIDLGCGDGMKARGWLEPTSASRYVGVDIADAWLRSALVSLIAQLAKDRASPAFRGRPLDVVGVVADFTRPFELHDVLAEAPTAAPVFFYPGSSIGNFTADDARAFLASVRDHIERHPAAGGKLLIGIDLVKDRATLEAAYDDAIGVTAAFNRNVLRVANELLDADFDPKAFDHRAVFDEDHQRIEMQLVSKRDQRVRIGDRSVTFSDGETIVTEYSHKYTVDGFAALLESAGFAGGDRLRCWRDARGWFGVFVAEPA
jgi:dimethylhistidine N-methyltransferase